MIEIAKSSRSACKTCKKNIEKGELRFGATSEMYPDSYQWHHLTCAVAKHGAELKAAMDVYEGEIPNREQLEHLIAHAPKVASGKFPYADHAPTSRAKCIECHEPIEKGTLRIAIERELDRGGFTQMGAGYMHPKCVKAHPEVTKDAIVANSGELSEADLTLISASLA